MGRMLVIRNRRQNCKKIPGGLTILYIKKKKKKNNIILDVYCVQNFGYKFHIPSKLCLQSTGNKYHNILDAYAGYKKLRVSLEKKVPTGSLFFFIKKKKKKKKLQYLMPIVFRISGDLLHTPC